MVVRLPETDHYYPAWAAVIHRMIHPLKNLRGCCRQSLSWEWQPLPLLLIEVTEIGITNGRVFLIEMELL